MERLSLLFSSLSSPLPSHPLMASKRKSLFRPCIDLHQGVVKQIVGASLRDNDEAKERALASSSASASDSTSLKTNFTSTLSPAHYANLYKSNKLTGGHVIKLGPGNEEAAEDAVTAWKDGLHVGGGINADNAKGWIERGAEKVFL
jgi:phosphoribosylformimino-5-aminoimidazole carboxamide ribotide isomerase